MRAKKARAEGVRMRGTRMQGAGMREVVDRHGLQLGALAAQCKAEETGLAGLAAAERVAVLHLLIEQVLCEDKDIWRRMEPEEIALACGAGFEPAFRPAAEALHPSWAAKRQSEGAAAIRKFEGKKITF